MRVEAAVEGSDWKAKALRFQSELQMIADSFEDWQEPQHDGSREWCGRFGTYLRGNVVAMATFTEEEWAKVRAHFDAANGE
jgi:hypothetical protein